MSNRIDLNDIVSDFEYHKCCFCKQNTFAIGRAIDCDLLVFCTDFDMFQIDPDKVIAKAREKDISVSDVLALMNESHKCIYKLKDIYTHLNLE